MRSFYVTPCDAYIAFIHVGMYIKIPMSAMLPYHGASPTCVRRAISYRDDKASLQWKRGFLGWPPSYVSINSWEPSSCRLSLS
ncbi:unnamed protein product, partial [Musa hybrid cultivar]